MSAFVVSDTHINTLVSFASLHQATYSHSGVYKRIKDREQDVAALLYAANVRSVNHRYDETEPFGNFVFRWVINLPSTLAILKACDCYEYQACETDDYPQSEAAAVINAIRAWAIPRLPGYDDEPWEIPDPAHDEPEVIRLI